MIQMIRTWVPLCALSTLLSTAFSTAFTQTTASAALDISDNRQFIKLDGDGETARCLDGSPYAFWVWPGNATDWSVFVTGGGWCLTEELCEVRSHTALGSSLGYNISGAWGPPPGNANGGPPAYTCQGLDPNCTRVFLPYCDGSCFTSHRDDPWPVNGSNSSLHFRGIDNMERTLDVLESRFGFANAQRLVLQGGSAGGLSTFLHLDRVADRLKQAQTRAADKKHRAVSKPPLVHQRRLLAGSGATNTASPKSLTVPALPRTPQHVSEPVISTARSPPSSTLASATTSTLVVGRPVAGFFIDEAHYDPSQPSYADDVEYGVQMFNSTPTLSSACKNAHSGQEWRCWMAPYMAPFVRSRVFVVQSRFDEFQLACLLGLPCFARQAYEPPFLPDNCTTAERAAIVDFGASLVAQMQPMLKAKQDTGTWLVSCIQHDVVCDLNGVKEEDAFASWLAGASLGKDVGYRWVDNCGKNGTTPCDVGSHCAPPHF